MRTRHGTGRERRTSGRLIRRCTSTTVYWRSGVARGLYASLFAILAVQRFCNAFAGIALPNPGSVGLHESVGFTPIGVYRRVGYKLGAWRDVGWWQRPLSALETPPEQPLSLEAVQSRADWTVLCWRLAKRSSGCRRRADRFPKELMVCAPGNIQRVGAPPMSRSGRLRCAHRNPRIRTIRLLAYSMHQRVASIPCGRKEHQHHVHSAQ